MADNLQDLMASIQNDPSFISGLANMRGGDPQEALLQNAQMQTQQAAAQASQEKLKRQKTMPSILAKVQNMPPEKAFDFLISIGMPTSEAMTLVKNMRGLSGGGDAPSNVREWNAYSKLSPEDQAEYRAMRRGQKTVDKGDAIVTLNPDGTVRTSINKELAPAQLAQTKEDQAAATARGKEIGEKQVLLKSISSKLPQLKAVRKKLSSLGKLATYTVGGKLWNTTVRQLGLDVSDSAVARASYISTVDNEILPLLKDTFGAQFTEGEGRALKVTLGDPDLSPPEKDAALNAFIDSKVRQVKSLEAEVGEAPDRRALYEKLKARRNK